MRVSTTYVIARNEAISKSCRSGRRINLLSFLTIIFSLFAIHITAYAQQDPTKKPEEIQKTKWEVNNTKYNNPAYFIDEKLIKDADSKQVIDNLDPYAILKTTIVRGATHRERNVIYITTDMARITAYQKKLGAFSKAYIDYLNAHQNRDVHFSYYINGKLIQGFRKDVIERLYDMPANKITHVRFNLDATSPLGNTVEITLK